jgi:hypothetical protein
MNNNILYISTFFIALIIIYLLKNDILKIKSILKKNLNSDTLVINNFNIPLNDKIYYKIWIKLYAIITIILIHISWLFLTFVCNYKDNTIFFAIPLYLFIPYIIYLVSYISKNEIENISNFSIDIDRLMNYGMILYFSLLIILLIINDESKKYIIEFSKLLVYNYFIK